MTAPRPRLAVSHDPVYRRRRIIGGAAVAVVGVLLGFGAAEAFWPGGASPEGEPGGEVIEASAVGTAPSPTQAPTVSPAPTATHAPTVAAPQVGVTGEAGEASADPGFDPAASSVDAADSPWVVVNKTRPIDPVDYAPGDLTTIPGMSTSVRMRAQAAAAMGELHAAAVAANAPFTVSTAYRDAATQARLYNGYVKRSGRTSADRYSARPGYSEHQTGLAADLTDGRCSLEACFGDSAAGEFVAEHAWKYGFIVRYPDGGEGVTGYIYEPWHLRYVGAALAARMRDTDVATLEEFFDLGAAPAYE